MPAEVEVQRNGFTARHTIEKRRHLPLFDQDMEPIEISEAARRGTIHQCRRFQTGGGTGCVKRSFGARAIEQGRLQDKTPFVQGQLKTTIQRGVVEHNQPAGTVHDLNIDLNQARPDKVDDGPRIQTTLRGKRVQNQSPITKLPQPVFRPLEQTVLFELLLGDWRSSQKPGQCRMHRKLIRNRSRIQSCDIRNFEQPIAWNVRLSRGCC